MTPEENAVKSEGELKRIEMIVSICCERLLIKSSTPRSGMKRELTKK